MSKPNRKETILKEAALLFKQKGYSATSMRELAEKIGIEAASLYNHIQSKDQILEEICFRVSNQYMSHIDAIEIQQIGTIDKLKALISLHVRTILNGPNEVSVANNDWKNLSDSKKENYKSIRKSYENKVSNLLEEGIRNQEIKCVNISVALFTLLSSFRWIEQWYREDREICPETLERDMITLIIGGYQNN